MPSMMYLTTTTNGIDTSVAQSIVELTKIVLGLFNEFPLNIFLGAALVGIGVGVYRSLKHS